MDTDLLTDSPLIDSHGNGSGGDPSDTSGNVNEWKPDLQATYRATLFPGDEKPIDPMFGWLVLEIEKLLDMPTWVLFQNGGTEEPISQLGTEVERLFILDSQILELESLTRAKEEKPEQIALIVDSPGGLARSAYKLATFFRSRCNGFTAVVPSFAKSSATLLCLGADRIIMGRNAELGPLDAQVFDDRTERWTSAIDEVQAIERLFASSLDALDRTMTLLNRRSLLRSEAKLRESMTFVARTLEPLYDKIDSVHYSQMERILRVAEAYAMRLLSTTYDEKTAKRIASILITDYPEHGFVINGDEAKNIGLEVHIPGASEYRLEYMLETMCFYSQRQNVIGRIKKESHHVQDEDGGAQ